MTLDDLGNLGELVSAIAVVISLVYLAIQIRQNTRSVRDSSFQELLNHHSQVNLRMTDAEIAELYRRAASAPFDRDSTDMLRWRGVVVTNLRHWAHAYALYRQGIISTEQWAMSAHGIPRIASYPAFQDEWRRLEKHYPAEFRAYMATCFGGTEMLAA